jgi:hypothetical protein
LWRRLDGAMTRALLPEFDVDDAVSLEFDTSEIPALQDDLTNERAQKIELWRSQVITRNEIRSDFGYAEIEDERGAELYAPASPFGALPMGDDEDEEEERTLRVVERVKAIPAHLNGHHPVRMQRLPPDTRAAVATTARDAYESIATPTISKMNGYWNRLADALTDEIGERSQNTAPETRAVENLYSPSWWDEWDEEFRGILFDLYDRAGRRAYAGVSSALGETFRYDIANPNIATMRQQLGTRIVGITETTRAGVDDVIRSSLTEGVDMTELGSRVKTLVRETYKSRSVTIARTESMVGYSAASVEGYRESGVVSMVEIADNAAHTDDYGASDGLSCSARNGIVVNLDRAMFHIEADHPNGSAAIIPLVDELPS